MFRCAHFTPRLREADNLESATTMAVWAKIAILVFVLVVIKCRYPPQRYQEIIKQNRQLAAGFPAAR